MSRLRPFQQIIQAGIFEAWGAGHRNVYAESPTGSGKTVIVADTVNRVGRAAAVIAHRAELVTQISSSLAREGVRHRIVGADSVRKNCVTLHMERFGRSFYDPQSRVGVCSILTLTGKDVKSDSWFSQVGLWVMDEAHHVLRENHWGKGVAMFPNAYGLGVSAMAWRGDGKGCGREADGVFDTLVHGPSMRDLIDAGYLTDYKLFTPPSDVDYTGVTVTASGDYSPAKLSAAVHASDTIVGDVVEHYRKICMQKLGRLGLGVTFAVDVDNAKEIAAAFNAAGIPSEIVSAKTPDLLRSNILKRFERREVMQLVNVDLFGEGFDLPAIEVISMVRKTESLQLFIQQFGRVLRLLLPDDMQKAWDKYSDAQRLQLIADSSKPFGIVIDHVGNCFRHGVPDAPRETSLDRRTSRATSASDAIPTRVCTNTNVGGQDIACAKTYERFHKCCPFCGFYPEPPARTAPQHVDGDLHELDAATLAAMRGKVIDLVAPPTIPFGLSPVAAASYNKRHHETTKAQFYLREAAALWAGWHLHLGRDDSQIQRLFFLTFGVDLLTAYALRQGDAEALTMRIKAQLDDNKVIAA